MNAQRKRQRYRRPAAWDRTCSGLPVALAAAQGIISMPPGAWHVSDYAAPALADPAVRVVEAVHASGQVFQLLMTPAGVILGVAARTEAGGKRIGHADPTAWARRQRWHLQPMTHDVAP